MAQTTHFTKDQLNLVNEISDMSEEFVLSFFGMRSEDWEGCRYDLKTQEFLSKKEKTDQALAQVCKYECIPPKPFQKPEFEFYRICLQDRLIIRTAEERNEIIKLAPLLLYIITHELVHITRFTKYDQRFHVKKEEKDQEEARVHNITYQVLNPMADHKVKGLKHVLDGFKKHRDSISIDN